MRNDLLESKLIADLHKTGFASEMHALKYFSDRNWATSNSIGYIDRDEDKIREIDLSAYIDKSKRATGSTISHLMHYEVIAEVKKASSPWIMFKSPQTDLKKLGIGWNNLVFTDDHEDDVCPKKFRVKRNSLLKVFMQSMAQRTGWVGSGMHESFKKPTEVSRWYSALVTVCKASEHSLQINSWDLNRSDKSDMDYLYFIQPTIILDGPLYSAEIDRDLGISLTGIDMATIHFDFSSSEYNRRTYEVNIVCLSALPDYIDWCERRCQNMFDAFSI